MTLLVRTRGDPGAPPQYSYLFPSIGFDPFERDPTLTRKLQLLTVLHATNRPEWNRALDALLDRADLETTFHVLRHVRKAAEPTFFAECCLRARSRQGSLAEVLVPAIEGERRRADIAELRSRVTDPELRYFLALLLNLTDRETILALTEARLPIAPAADTIVRWIGRLSEVRYAVQAGPATFEINAAGMEVDDLMLSVARLLLGGATAASIVESMAASTAPGADVPEPARVRRAYQALTASPLLRPLFQNPAG